MSDATQTKTSPPRKRKRSAMTLDTKLKMVHVMYVQVFYSGYIKRYKYKCQCTLNHIYFEELWGCSKIRAFPSYGQCPVPSCPDKGSLSVHTYIHIHTYIHTYIYIYIYIYTHTHTHTETIPAKAKNTFIPYVNSLKTRMHGSRISNITIHYNRVP